MNFILDMVTSATVSAILSGGLLWFTKSWISERLKNAIKSEYDEKLETHKAQLKAQTDIEIETLKANLKSQNDVEIEKLKSNLSIATAEHHVTFSKLHEQRAQVIADSYAFLKEVYLKIQDYVKVFEPAGDKSRDERRKHAVEAHLNLRDYYPKKIIYLPKATAEKIEKIDMALVQTFNEFVFTVDMKKHNSDLGKWVEIFKRMDGEMKDALNDLEDEFRLLLGDKSNKEDAPDQKSVR
ncbi:MAG: hypothetical protein VB050_12280 [Geobacteraceae bacterium]|nr:hypothetical protein [Geobacteraceae bacterium]